MNLLTGLLVGWFIASLVTGAVLGKWFRWLRFIADEDSFIAYGGIDDERSRGEDSPMDRPGDSAS